MFFLQNDNKHQNKFNQNKFKNKHKSNTANSCLKQTKKKNLTWQLSYMYYLMKYEYGDSISMVMVHMYFQTLPTFNDLQNSLTTIQDFLGYLFINISSKNKHKQIKNKKYI